MSGPPPPPPHGGVPKGSGLPPGKYDIFVIPEHSAGSGFLYLPSLRPNVNSFAAGFATALILVALFQSMAPAFRAWWDGFQGMGNMGIAMMVMGVGFGAWSLGRIQEGGSRPRYGPSASGFNDGSGGYGGTGSRTSANSGGPRPPPHGNSTPPPPPPHNEPPPQPPPQQERHKSNAWEAPGTPPPDSEPRPPPRSHPPPPQTPPQTPPRSQSRPPPTPKSEGPPKRDSSTWEKAREELRKKEEERKAREAEQKRRDDAARRLAELRAREAKERQEREKERERLAREAKERKERIEAEQRAKELSEKLEQERKERERLEKEAREIREREEQRLRDIKAEEDRKQKEAQEREEKRKKEALEREERRKRLQKQREEMRKREAEEAQRREEAKKKKDEENAKAEAEKEKVQAESYTQARKGTGYAFSNTGEKTSMWPNGRPPVAKSTTSSSPGTPKPPASPSVTSDATTKPPPGSSANRSNVSNSKTGKADESHSYRPYDKPKQPQRKRSTSSLTGSESSWAPSQTTTRTSPPPSVRGPYSTNDPEKIVISAVYLFMNQYAKTPASQLISGVGAVTDGLILRITTEGLFIDDDVRGVPQREWDVKAWTLKLTEVWCPPHCLNNNTTYSTPAAAKTNPLLYKMAASRNRDRGSTKPLTGDEADLYLNDMLRACKDCCKLGLCDQKFKGTNVPSSTGQTGEWKSKGLHILRATVRDQEGKRYVFVIDETEAWKMAMGLQRLRRGTQVRQLGLTGLTGSEARGTLEMLGWTA